MIFCYYSVFWFCFLRLSRFKIIFILINCFKLFRLGNKFYTFMFKVVYIIKKCIKVVLVVINMKGCKKFSLIIYLFKVIEFLIIVYLL